MRVGEDGGCAHGYGTGIRTQTLASCWRRPLRKFLPFLTDAPDPNVDEVREILRGGNVAQVTFI